MTDKSKLPILSITSNGRSISWIVPELVIFAAACWLYFVFFETRLSRGLIDFTNFFVEENAIILLSLFLIFLLTYQIPGWIGRSLRWIVLLTFFAIFLRGYWQLKRSAYFQLFGLLPWVDSIEYYANGLRLLNGFAMQGTTVGRPLFSTMLAGLLWITKGNLPQTIIVVAGLTAFGIYLLGEAVKKTFGSLVAAVMISFTFMWYRNYLGGLSSESLGLILACLGWSFLLATFRKHNLWWIGTGFFFVTLALVTRAGPFFILPFMLLVYWFFSKKADRIKTAVVIITSSAAAFLVNTIILRIVSGGKSFLFPNYLYSVYGMASGGKGWNYIHSARPDLWALPEPIRTSQIFDATLELIKQDPFQLIVSMLRQYVFFVEKSNTSMFSYLFARVDAYNIAIMVVLYGLSILSIYLLIRSRKEQTSLFLLAVILGVLLSVPFVPPQDESDMRAFAVVVPILAILPAYGASWLVKQVVGYLKSRASSRGQSQSDPNVTVGQTISLIPVWGFSAAILVLGIIPALILNGVKLPANLVAPTCPEGQTPFVWRNIRQNSVTIMDELPYNDVHFILPRQVEQLSHDVFISNVVDLFQYFTVNQTVSEEINLLNGESAFLFHEKDGYFNKGGLYSGCGVKMEDSHMYIFDVFLVKEPNMISN